MAAIVLGDDDDALQELLKEVYQVPLAALCGRVRTHMCSVVRCMVAATGCLGRGCHTSVMVTPSARQPALCQPV